MFDARIGALQLAGSEGFRVLQFSVPKGCALLLEADAPTGSIVCAASSSEWRSVNGCSAGTAEGDRFHRASCGRRARSERARVRLNNWRKRPRWQWARSVFISSLVQWLAKYRTDEVGTGRRSANIGSRASVGAVMAIGLNEQPRLRI
jgi:hypothetical protein